MRTLVIAGIGALVFVGGVLVGSVAGGSPELPAPCAQAMAAADAVAAAIETQWSTASEAVDAAQAALNESDYGPLAQECRLATS
jgi:hypothetical protein